MKYLPLVLVLLLILAACASQEPSKAKQLAEELKNQTTEKTTENATQPAEEAKPVEQKTQAEQPAAPAEQKTEAPATSTEEKAAVEETTSPPQQRTKMYRFLDTFAKDVKSYEFVYKGNSYSSKGTRYKVILAIPVTVKHVTFGNTSTSLFYYDTVYVDRAAKTAIAYCEGHSSVVNKQCVQFDLYDLAYPVDFKAYDITLPEDWLFAYLNKEPDQLDANKYYINARSSVLVKFNENPGVELNIDPNTGLPLRVDQTNGNRLIARYEYDELVANKVRDVDVRHRSRSEIPTSEAFYKGNI